MKANDLVRRKSPCSGFPHGFILSIEGDMAKVYGLSIVSGEWTMTRNLPLCDLELDDSPELFRAYYINRNADRKRRQTEELLAKRYTELLAMVGKKHGVSPETVERIFEDVKKHQDSIPSIIDEASKIPAGEMLVTCRIEDWPQLKNVKPFWTTNYYDGPLSGIAIMFGSRYMFEFWEEKDTVRKYALLRLTGDQEAEEGKWHSLFEEHVGTDPQKPQAEWSKFYDPYKKEYKPPMFTEADIVGWFDDAAFLDDQYNPVK